MTSHFERTMGMRFHPALTKFAQVSGLARLLLRHGVGPCMRSVARYNLVRTVVIDNPAVSRSHRLHAGSGIGASR